MKGRGAAPARRLPGTLTPLPIRSAPFPGFKAQPSAGLSRSPPHPHPPPPRPRQLKAQGLNKQDDTEAAGGNSNSPKLARATQSGSLRPPGSTSTREREREGSQRPTDSFPPPPFPARDARGEKRTRRPSPTPPPPSSPPPRYPAPPASPPSSSQGALGQRQGRPERGGAACLLASPSVLTVALSPADCWRRFCRCCRRFPPLGCGGGSSLRPSALGAAPHHLLRRHSAE